MTTSPESASADEFAERLFGSALATAETMSVYLGDKLGWYVCLVDHGPITADELAERSGTHPRYAQEWLEMQSAFGILDADLAVDPVRFSIAPGPAEVLTDTSSLSFLGTLPQMFAASFTHRHARLSRPGARIVDIGFGGGHSTIALAEAYPEASIVGLDIDKASVAMARRNAAEAGVADQVEFLLADGAAAASRGPFDVAFAFECLHDMPRPVDVLAAARAALAPGGSMVIMDEAVSDEFAGPADDLDRIMYGFSLFVCLPDSMSSPPSAATGTVMRPSTLQPYAHAAGFTRVDVLPIEDFGFFRFYELVTD